MLDVGRSPPLENRGPSGHQCLAEFDQHDFHFGGLVFDPARLLAAARCLHDPGADFIDAVSGWLPCVSRPCRRALDPFHGPGNYSPDLFRDADLAHPARVCDAAARHPHPGAGLSTTMGTPYPDRALDDADLALR